MKWIIRIVLVVVLLVTMGVGVILFYIDFLAKKGIEKGAAFALGTQATLQNADVKPWAGKFVMEALDVSNPRHQEVSFESDHFLTLDSGKLKLDLGSLIKDTVAIREIVLDGIDIVVEKKGEKTNYGVIFENLGQLSSKKDETFADEPGKKFVVHRVKLSNMVVHIAMPPNGSVDKPLNVHIPDIELQNVGTGGNQVMAIPELTGIITGAIFHTLIKEAPGAIPEAVLGSLDSALVQAGIFGELPANLVAQISEQLKQQTEKVLQDMGKTASGLGEGAKRSIDEALKGLGGLVPRDKK